MASRGISKRDVGKASLELRVMRGSLAAWMRRRLANDAAGIRPQTRFVVEQDLANKLHALLSEVLPDAPLPNANLRANPSGALQLAKIAITGQAPVMESSSGMGGGPPWMWPVLIVGGLLIAVTTAIRAAADVAKDAEEKECIKAGACTDSGFWMKWAAIIGLGWFAWKELGVGEQVRALVKKGRS